MTGKKMEIITCTNIAIAFTFIICVQTTDAAKILGIFPMASKSHYSLGNSLMRGLAGAGHNVTMISPYDDTEPTTNGSLNNVVLTGFAEKQEAAMKNFDLFKNVKVNSFKHFPQVIEYAALMMEKTFSHPNIVTFLNTTETYDVVIVEHIFTEAFRVFAHHFKAHLILFSSVAIESKLNYVVGNPTMLAYTPQIDTNFSREMTLYQRIHNFLLYAFETVLMQYQWLPYQDKLIQKYFPGFPSIFDLSYNVSLILVNSHESIQPAIPLVPNVIPVGGFHVKKPKALPVDLQKYLDNATEGVVYVSFGSTLKAVNLPANKKEVLLTSFKNLKEKVLWKWEDENVPNLPPNVRTRKWFPQNDILAHPNVKLFITQGGLLSLTEAIYNGVPVLTVPVFGDQSWNSQNVILDEYGLGLSFHDQNFANKFHPMIEQILNDPKYKENAKKRSQFYHDRNIDPMQQAIYWIEYVIRHNGAPHLRVTGLKLPWYKHYLLDVITVVITTFVFIVISIVATVKYALRCYRKKNRQQRRKQIKKKINKKLK